MAITVIHAAHIVDGQIVFTQRFESSRATVRPGDLVGLLTGLGPHPDGGGPELTVLVKITEGPTAQAIPMALERFLSAAEYQQSHREPLSLARVEMVLESRGEQELPHELFWLFRDDVYAVDRIPRISEREEIVLRTKALHFQAADTLRRLREQVANSEATVSFLKNQASRQPLPDDVKLAVWARDGGCCVRCGAARELHFDHIIPLSRGGGDHFENIQLLCRTCNLAKGARLA